MTRRVGIPNKSRRTLAFAGGVYIAGVEQEKSIFISKWSRDVS